MRPFDSKRWKKDYRARHYIFQYAYRFLLGKTEAEVRQWLGEPEWIGLEGVFQPKEYEEGAVAWNYISKPPCKKHGGLAFQLKMKDGRLVGHSAAYHRPLSHFGLPIIYAHSMRSKATYLLESVISGSEVQRLYFPKTGALDFNVSEIDSSGHGSGTDEQGQMWSFEGFANPPQHQHHQI